MRVVVQRVSSAQVSVGGRVAGRIGPGLLVLVGIERPDTEADSEWLARKLCALRIFADESGQMNRSVVETGGGLLVVSQFTLHASTRKGNRPSFNQAAPPESALTLYRRFLADLAVAAGRPVEAGEFGAMMEVSLVNDGPVTLMIDSRLRE